MKTANHQDQDLVGCDIVDLLHERNEQIRNAFAQVIAAEGPVKATLFAELVTILAGREAVVQELTRPLVGRHGPQTPAVHTGPAEQPKVISGLALVSGLDAEDEDFAVALRRVAGMVTSHIDAKERHDLPLLRRSLPADELQALAEVLLSAETITRARPTANETEVTSFDALGPRDVYAPLGDTIQWRADDDGPQWRAGRNSAPSRTGEGLPRRCC